MHDFTKLCEKIDLAPFVCNTRLDVSQPPPPQQDDDAPVDDVDQDDAADVNPELRRCRRFVGVSPRVKFGRGVKLFAYGYADLAALLGMSESAVRQAVGRKTFTPGDLRSVFEYLLTRLGDRRVRQRLLGPLPPPDKDAK